MKLTSQQKKEYDEKGYVIIKGFLKPEVVEHVLQENSDGRFLNQHTQERKDAQGNVSRISLWNHPEENVYGNIARHRSLVEACEELLGQKVYHWHTKMMLKEARTGGAWEWHQDYGYWYNYGCLTPDLISCMMAINRANRENGCLEVLEGSHKIGRINHGMAGEQVGADLAVVAAAEKRYKRIYVEMEPGDALFFHSNLLHTSAPNRSDKPRLVLISCYNTIENSPYIENSRHPHYTPLHIIEDDKILTQESAQV